jgi:hypothetical protein
VAALGRSGWLALIVALLLVGLFEAWVRGQGVPPEGYLNSAGSWAEQRRRIDRGEGDAWVFTGSSRVKFNLQVPVWERLDGRAPIQLSLEGTSPVRVLEGLAEDEDFTGRVIVGVAPGLFFSGYEGQARSIDRYEQESPSQWLGHRISLLLEPLLSFYDQEFSLSRMLGRLDLPVREGMEWDPEVRKLAYQDRVRNTRMWDRLEYDAEYRELARRIWAAGWKPFAEREPEYRERMLKKRGEQIERAVAAVEKLWARGAEAIFVTMPYEGHYAVSEPDRAPRELTWDRLIEETGALGLHFEDHPEMQGYHLPEWSHMTAAEADRFTAVFYELVQRELAARAADGGNP